MPCSLSAYKTVSGVNGPLVILDQVKVKIQILNDIFEEGGTGKAKSNPDLGNSWGHNLNTRYVSDC